MLRLLHWLVVPGYPFPTTALVFFTVAIVALVQIPASIIIHSYSLTAGVLLNEVLVITGIPLFLIARFHFDRRQLLPLLRPSGMLVLWVVILTVGADVIIDYLTAASERVFPLPVRYAAGMEQILHVSSAATFGGKLVLLCLIPAVCEEIFFRGFCQTTLTTHWGQRSGIIITACLFAFLHANPWYIHLYFLLGLLFSWLYATSGNLWLPMLAHAVNNTWTFVSNASDVSLPPHGINASVHTFIIVGGVALFMTASQNITARK